MAEIRLVKRYPHIKDEDITSIFQEGYIKGFENGRKGAIPIEWLKTWFSFQQWVGSSMSDRIYCKASDIIEDFEKEILKNQWEKENGTRNIDN